MSNRVQELFDANIRKVVKSYERGEDISSIASKIGVSPPTISKWLNKEGYKRKKKGRVPIAMKARVRDLHLRGWDDNKISSFLDLRPDQVSEWASPIGNPILGGEKDPLKVKGLKSVKKDKKLKKKSAKKEKEEKWPPPKHRCRKHWKPIEKAYVLELMENGVRPGAIYKRMRASKGRQTKIWHDSGGKGRPPNFPPPRDAGPPPTGPAPVRGRRSEVAALEAASDAKIATLEAAASARQERIRALEAQAEEEKRKIKRLELEQKMLLAERMEKDKNLAIAQKAMESRGSKKPVKRRVLPGSYEKEVLGLKEGSIIDQGKPGRPSLGIPDNLGEYADNGEFFTVSNDWADLEDATRDELEAFALTLSSKGFPAKVSRGDQPKAFFDESWPKSIEDKWIRAVDSSFEFLEKYKARKDVIAEKRSPPKGISEYLASAHDAYGGGLSGDQAEYARDDMLDNWARLSKVDRYILVLNMGMANKDGEPTSKGIEAGRSAKMHLRKISKSAEPVISDRARRKSEVDAILGTRRPAKKLSADTGGAKRSIAPADKNIVDEILGKKKV